MMEEEKNNTIDLVAEASETMVEDAGNEKPTDPEMGVTMSGRKEESKDALLEPYMSIEDIADLHPETHIRTSSIEQSRGLTSEEATKRLGIYGRNILTPPPKIPEWRRFLKQFQNIFLILLIVSALLSIGAYFVLHDITNIYLAVVLLVVVFLTGLLQFHEEGKALEVAESFKTLLATACTVFRDGRQSRIDVCDLVPGDLVQVTSGEKVPADMVLLLCRGLKVECSSLTGESEPLYCTEATSRKDIPLLECKNVVFNGSMCIDGTAIGIVVNTGDQSQIGKIAKLVNEADSRETVIQTEVKNFVKLVAVIAVVMATSAFIASIFIQDASTTEEIVTLFINGFLTILVANVPQGLPSTVISLLSLAARRMAKKSVLVKRIDCVETLGSCSIICSDKTGTLTKNCMTVTHVWFDGRLISRPRIECESLFTQEPQALFFRAGVLCNRAQPITPKAFSEREDSHRDIQMKQLRNVSALSWQSSVRSSKGFQESLEAPHGPKFLGNPSDIAILTFCDRYLHDDWQRLRRTLPIEFEVPFNSRNKWQLVIVKGRPSSPENVVEQVEYEVLMKGAPEVILSRCTTYACRKSSAFKAEITEEFRQHCLSKNEEFASEGRRVLALCSKTFRAPADIKFGSGKDDEYNFPTQDLNFIGLCAIIDPPRDNVKEAIEKCQSAGVKVFMVTGDHPSTATAIAKEITLLKSDNNFKLLENETSEMSESYEGAVVHGTRIDALSDDEWKFILSRPGGVCFARTTPAHKLTIVKRCQQDQIVAVTGDGVNDAPALKQADIGIAMGLNGSAVAQDAADCLLMDDNFASIVAGIEEGRIIFDNIKKTIAYTMAHIFPQAVSALIALLFGIPAGLTPMQVLTMDLGTELGPAISLAYEKAESNIMQRMPRDPKRDRLVSPRLLFYSYVTAGFVGSALCLVAYTLTYKSNGLELSDFHEGSLKNSGGAFFSLTAEEPVEVQRTGRVYQPQEQKKIFSEGVTVYYITLALSQFVHIWACKTRTTSLFKHGFDNKLTFYGVAIGLALMVFFSYVPGVQDIVGSTQVGWIPWVLGPASGCILLLYNEALKCYFGCGPQNQNVLIKLLSW